MFVRLTTYSPGNRKHLAKVCMRILLVPQAMRVAYARAPNRAHAEP
jgi:hypothetical protein